MNPELTTRRTLLHRGLELVAAAGTVPTFLERSALAAARPGGARTRSRPGVPEDHVLVVLQLGGGNDGLNTIIPVGNDLYYTHRKRLAIAANDALRVDDVYAMHPALAGLKSLYDDGEVAIVHGIGYPNPNRSHFKSMDIWHSASPEGRHHTGWIGRYFDSECGGRDPCDPKTGIALMAESPLAMNGDAFQPAAFPRPEMLTWNGPRAGMRGSRKPWRARRAEQAALMRAFDRLNAPDDDESPASDELAYLQRTAMDARLSAAEIQQATRKSTPVSYPGSPLANSLRLVARMIAADMPTRIYYVSQGGFDTHANQLPRHQQLLTQFSDGLKAFVDDLKATKQFERVTIMTFSEFGRRVGENASGGTDHGEAAPMMLIGGRVIGGMHGQACSLDKDKLHRGDLAWTTDFRRVYATVLSRWLGADAKAILGQAFEPMDLISKA